MAKVIRWSEFGRCARTRFLVWCCLLLYGFYSHAAASDAQTAQSKPQFDVWEYQIQGNSRLAAIDIERAVYVYLGPAKTIDDVELARAALEQVYRDKGFATVLVDIPEQDVIDGVVYLSVTEGQVE